MATPQVQVIEAARQPRQRWKNGGGSTTQVAAYPPDATLDDFDWRISMARMERDGPFSLFPGVDRTLAILKGAGVVLTVEGVGDITVTQFGSPASFPGDRATQARLIGGPITDLNIMSRRGRRRHRLRFTQVDGMTSLVAETEVLVALCLADVQVDIAGERWSLRAGDAAVLSSVKGAAIILRAAHPAPVWLVDIEAFSSA